MINWFEVATSIVATLWDLADQAADAALWLLAYIVDMADYAMPRIRPFLARLRAWAVLAVLFIGYGLWKATTGVADAATGAARHLPGAMESVAASLASAWAFREEIIIEGRTDDVQDGSQGYAALG